MYTKIDYSTERLDHLLRLNRLASMEELMKDEILPYSFDRGASRNAQKFPIAFKSACGKDVVTILDMQSDQEKCAAWAMMWGRIIGLIFTDRSIESLYDLKLYVHIKGELTALNAYRVIFHDASVHGIYFPSEDNRSLKRSIELEADIMDGAPVNTKRYGIYLEKSVVEA